MEKQNKNIKILSIGDSITEGYKTFFSTVTYPNYLQKILNSKFKNKKFEVVNYGIGGTTVLAKSDNPYIKHKNFENAKNVKA